MMTMQRNLIRWTRLSLGRYLTTFTEASSSTPKHVPWMWNVQKRCLADTSNDAKMKEYLSEFLRVDDNEKDIRVRLYDENGRLMGRMLRSEARAKAVTAGLHLAEMQVTDDNKPGPPCYQMSAKRVQKKPDETPKLASKKELRLKATIRENELASKMKSCDRWLAKGLSVKISVRNKRGKTQADLQRVVDLIVAHMNGCEYGRCRAKTGAEYVNDQAALLILVPNAQPEDTETSKS